MRRPRALHLALPLATTLGIAGCGNGLPEIDVEGQWQDSMRRLGMFGLYPMTEDVQVGDVLLSVPTEDGVQSSRPRFSTMRIGPAPRGLVRDALQRQEEDRVRVRWAAP